MDALFLVGYVPLCMLLDVHVFWRFLCGVLLAYFWPCMPVDGAGADRLQGVSAGLQRSPVFPLLGAEIACVAGRWQDRV